MSRSDRAAAARKASGRRRMIDPTTCEVEYGADDLEFQRAVDRYRRERRRPFPTLKELLEIARGLGYRREAGPGPTPGGDADAGGGE